MTPSEASINSTCWSCLPDKLTAFIYLLAVNAGMSDPATVAANSACWACVPDKWAAALYLLDNGGSGGGGGGGGGTTQIATGSSDPVGAPAAGIVFFVRTDVVRVLQWNGSAWVVIVSEI
jgi:hypothetical protein